MSVKFLGKWFLVFFVLFASNLIAQDKKPGASDAAKDKKKVNWFNVLKKQNLANVAKE